jgi:hypothetical protein
MSNSNQKAGTKPAKDQPKAGPQEAVTRVVAQGPGGATVTEVVKPGATWTPDRKLPAESLVGKTWVVVEGYTTVQMDGSFPRINPERIARDLGLDRASCLCLGIKEQDKLKEALAAGLKFVGVEHWDRMRKGEEPGLVPAENPQE